MNHRHARLGHPSDDSVIVYDEYIHLVFGLNLNISQFS